MIKIGIKCNNILPGRPCPYRTCSVRVDEVTRDRLHSSKLASCSPRSLIQSKASSPTSAGTSQPTERKPVEMTMDEDDLGPNSISGVTFTRQGSSLQQQNVNPEDTPEGITDVEATSVAPIMSFVANQRDLVTLSYAVLIGGVVATSVYAFDVTIQAIHDLPDLLAARGIGGGRSEGFLLLGSAVPFRCIMPIGAGVLVAWLQAQGFAPPLKAVTRSIDNVQDDARTSGRPKDYAQVLRKALASAITLGSGASLGPEAPSVELGANTAFVMSPKHLSRRRQRMLLAAGAAAGVSAAFDAPVAGALFAVEFVLKSSRLGLDRLSTSTVFVSTSVAAGVVGFLRAKGQALGILGSASHLVGRIPYFSMQPNLLYDVLEFSLLGVGCASAAVMLYEGVRASEIVLRPLPRWVSAPLAGALCGAIAYKFPQVQYGYVNLEEIFRDSTNLSVGSITALLFAKVAATSVCVGGGLVGGLFAPSLFLGALVGDIVGQYFTAGVADNATFVVVGAAAVLGASCRAPLTAIALMVEITRDTGLLVPLLAAIGTASVVTDYLEGKFSEWLEAKLIEMYLKEKAMFWGASLLSDAAKDALEGPKDAVEAAMSVTTNLYVRYSLPLSQAREAMAARGVKAAVVVDDDFRPKGVVYMAEVEEELVRQRQLKERDNNFNRSD
ncbi:hypothetical protein CEUSTIGMA_g6210.t1 [Chlamydomonas eustigma]|uniref:Chloride channel protein n=1 Tax=Chlamydomonas eustigma TaxID=1157962 RepID=A0A250X6Q4_9CHLO|nr:hypothetical protein CEUSTIGMA_g6210.t1 [Chlamydomonas eustigma]|eukprot:GAX78773.1 hypothetical protein CEUSTIGMA_g6210.t1 [Chlamydomonas eustigma]